MLRFGLPTVPADASVYALQVADRLYLFRAFSSAAAGHYAIAIKLATVVFVAVRGFQYAWPPLAYSIESDEEAGRLYSLVTTYYALATGVVVCGGGAARALAGPAARGAPVLRRLPRAAVAGARVGAVRPVPRVRRDRRRARATPRATCPRRVAGLAVNVAAARAARSARRAPAWGSPGAGVALCGAYVAMLAVMYVLTRGLFRVGFEWLRLAQLAAILATVAVSGELLLPTHGLAGLALRTAWLALVPAALVLTRFFHPHERAQARRLLIDARRRVSAFRAGHGDIEAYAEDPLKDV